MNRNEYVETLVLNGKMINIGQDDAGQCYFVEWVDDDGELMQESCGTYNFHYKKYAEYKFGNPESDCVYYSTQDMFNCDSNCAHRNEFGYCDKCYYQDVNWSHFQKLVKLGILDRRGNILPPYDKILVKESDNKTDEEQ